MTKIALCQMEVVAKRPDLNSAKIISMLREAQAKGAKVASFPEMAVPGYMVGDDWEDRAFVEDCIGYHADIQEVATQLGIDVIFGSVTKGAGNYEDGRKMRYNSALMLRHDKDRMTAPYHKANRPNYREFDDKRYFGKGTGVPTPEYLDTLWASMSICEDGWDDDYASKPISVAREQLEHDPAHEKHGDNQETHVHFNLSCSPYTLGKNGARNRRFAQHSNGFSALCYVNCVGIQNNGKNVFTFDGSSTVYVTGAILASLPPLQECIGYIEVGDTVTHTDGPWIAGAQKDPELHEVMTYAIQRFLKQSWIKKVVIGLSGGIDSALSAMLHVKAIGKQNVILVNMPSKHNSNITKDIAKSIASNLGCVYLKASITDPCRALVDTIDGSLAFKDLDKDFKWDHENIQARMRGAGIQAALAAGFKAVFPNNGNKAETTVGYCTMAGDHMGYLAPIGDLWKHEVYATSKQLSDEMGGILPESIFVLKPSAELSEDQNVTMGKGDPLTYWYHDKLLASWVEPWCRDNFEDTLQAYKDNTLLERLGLTDRAHDFYDLFPTAQKFIDDLERWWKQYKGMGTVKRVQSPPVVVLKRRAFGYDLREAIGSGAFTRRYNKLKSEILATPK